ncbi:hypothetical protein MRB53_041233 [Persea americana]|nr:hypothetical protein MRB53_041233 [Persea americana]
MVRWVSSAEGEPTKTIQGEKVLGGENGLVSFMREWTTAHPKVDPKTKEMLMFHSSFAPPFVQYSILPESNSDRQVTKMLNAPVPGIGGARMMHDFGVSPSHTIIMDLPLSLDPMEQMKGRPPVNFDGSKPSRFGVFPRRHPEAVHHDDLCSRNIAPPVERKKVKADALKKKRMPFFSKYDDLIDNTAWEKSAELGRRE